MSKREKHVLRTLSSKGVEGLSDFDVPAVDRLVGLGLVRAAFVEGHRLEAADLTTMGKEYIYGNPRLQNPINWAKVSAIAAIVSAVAAVIALLIACSLIV